MYFNFLLDYLKELDIPDTEFESGGAKGYINDNFAFIKEAPSNIDLHTDKSINSLKISAKNLKVGFKSKEFLYKKGIIKASGSVDATISNITLDIAVGFGSQKLADGRMVPIVTVPKVSLDIPKKYIDIKIKGNILIAFANAFKGFFIQTMTGTITKLISKKVQSELPLVIN